MTVFGVRVKIDVVTDIYFKGLKERLAYVGILKNPFIGDVRKYKDMYVISMRPLYPNFTPLFWLAAAGMYYVWGFSKWLVPPVVLGMAGFFWTKYFFYLVLNAGLRKAGYKDSARLVGNNEVIERIAFGGRK